MRDFVRALVQTGCTLSKAAEWAGYSNSKPEILAQRGSTLAHRRDVQAALHEHSIEVLRADAQNEVTIYSRSAGSAGVVASFSSPLL